jgi:hypothetical protein
MTAYYSTQYVTEKTGATGRQLDHWAGKGWLTSPAPGTGRSRQWTQFDLDLVTIIMRLRSAGIELEMAYKCSMAVMAAKRRDNGVRIKLRDGIWLVMKGM